MGEIDEHFAAMVADGSYQQMMDQQASDPPEPTQRKARKQPRPPKHHRLGIHRGLPFELYASIPNAVNSTALRWLGLSPRECWHRRRFERIVTDAMRKGSLAHLQILDPAQYLDRVVEWKEPVLEQLPPLQWDKVDAGNYATKCGRYYLELVLGAWHIAADGVLLPHRPSTVTAAKATAKEHYELNNPRQPKLDSDGNPKIAPQNPNSAAYQAFLAANPGRTVVTRKELDEARAIEMAVRDNPKAAEVLRGMWGTEVSVVWLDPDTGVKCKGRLDWLTSPRDPRVVLIGDLKLCKDNAPPWFPRDAARREYYAQKAWYRAGLREAIRQLYGTSPEIHCVLLAVQSGGSHDSTVYDLDDAELAAGDELNAKRLQEFLGYLDSHGERPWPGKCWRAPLNLAEHAPHVLGDDSGDNYGGPKVDFGDM